jgi:hypothetical protein
VRLKISPEIYLSTKPTEKSIPEMAQSESEIFVEKISQEFAHSIVTPSTMHQ